MRQSDLTKNNGGRQRRSLAAFICGLAFASQSAVAQSSAVDGIGSRTCAAVLEARENDRATYFAFASWVNGFVTAANGHDPDTFDLTPWQTPEYVMAQISRSCDGNADATLAEATSAYIRFLTPSRLTEPTPLVAIGNDDVRTFVYLEVLTQLRDKIEQAGFLTGLEPPEAYGASFQKAVMDYQRANGLRVTGLPDTATLAHVLR